MEVIQAVRAPLDMATADNLAELFRALADPTRVRIISLLVGTEVAVSDIAARLDMSVSAISHQLNLLRLLRVVASRREGRQVLYRLDDEHVEMMFRQSVDHIKHS
ncbi:MAG: metalloregulator ArsR/SmtB family transcription factor [Chloroflexi bacterium]|nr:metalloregulator ArsR/SmtB family transcription factor [Chloroflexota bacterium]